MNYVLSHADQATSSGYDCRQGQISFDNDGDLIRGIDILQIRSGVAQQVGSFDPTTNLIQWVSDEFETLLFPGRFVLQFDFMLCYNRHKMF